MKIKIVFTLIIILTCSFFSNSEPHNQVPQLQPLSPHGSKVVLEHWKIGTLNTSNIKTKYIGVPYGTISKTQTLDIYLPNRGKGPFPVILAIHGGAFMMGNSKMLPDVGPMIQGVNHGYAVVSINYRMAGEALFPRAVNDAKAAVRFVRANAKKYDLNPNKIVAWGASAGGNLVAMLGTTGNVQDLNGDDTENLGYSSAVQVVVDWFGPCDFTRFDEQFKSSGYKHYNSSIRDDSHESWYIGQNVLKNIPFTEKANPATYIPTMNIKTAPYFYIQHGTSDHTVPEQQSINFANALKAKLGSKKVTLQFLKGADHFGPQFTTQKNIDEVYNYLSKLLQ